MQVGDLVSLKMKKTQPAQVPRLATVVEVWRNHKNVITTIDVMWSDENGSRISGHAPALFEVVSSASR